MRLDKFVTDYNKLIDAILELNKETRFILLSPIRHEKLPPPLPDPARHNEFLASYTKAIQGIAEKRMKRDSTQRHNAVSFTA